MRKLLALIRELFRRDFGPCRYGVVDCNPSNRNDACATCYGDHWRAE